MSGTGAYEPEITQEIGREIDLQGQEKRLIRNQAKKMTKIEIRTIEDIAELLIEIQQIIEKHKNNLPKEKLHRISHILKEILKKENIYKKSVLNLRKIFQQIGVKDVKQLQEQKERKTKVDEKEGKIVKAEIVGEEEKIKLEKSIIEFEQKLERYMNSFNDCLNQAINHIRASPYPYDAKPFLAKARMVLQDIAKILKEVKLFEDKLIKLTKEEKGILKKERDVN